MNESARPAAEVADLVAKRTGRAIDVELLTERPRLGDAIAFRAREGLVAHRLVGGDLLSFRAAGRMVADQAAAGLGRPLQTV